MEYSIEISETLSRIVDVMADWHGTIDEATAFIDKTVDGWYVNETDEDEAEEQEEDIDIRKEVRGFEK